MRSFVIQLAAFASIQILICATCLLLSSSGRSDYIASALDKQALLRSAPRERMILVGGSNLAFGMDSRRIRDRLGYHPVNMGVHAGFGLPYMLNQVAGGGLQHGDVVVISMEYAHFGEMLEPDVILLELLAADPSDCQFIDREQLAWVVDNGLGVCASSVRSATKRLLRMPAAADVLRAFRIPENEEMTLPYTRNGFNEFGDLTSHWKMPPRRPFVPHNPHESTRVLDHSIDRLNQFCEECRSRGVRVYYSHPPVERSHFDKNQDVIQQMAARLRERLAFPILNEPEDLALNERMFFDSIYHLTAEGAALRTTHLIADLCREDLVSAKRVRNRSIQQSQHDLWSASVEGRH